MNFVKKLFGLVLLFGGLIIILYAIYSSYNIFTANKEAPAVFEITEQAGAAPEGVTQDIQAQLQNLLQDQLKGILPVASITELFNLISWSIFAGILILGGAQISGLGIKLIK